MALDWMTVQQAFEYAKRFDPARYGEGAKPRRSYATRRMQPVETWENTEDGRVPSFALLPIGKEKLTTYRKGAGSSLRNFRRDLETWQKEHPNVVLFERRTPGKRGRLRVNRAVLEQMLDATGVNERSHIEKLYEICQALRERVIALENALKRAGMRV